MRIVTEHDELTHAIIGCAMRVHSALGNGFPEVIYQNALALELERGKLTFVREAHLPVYYLDTQIGARRVDFLVADRVLVELKAVTALGPDTFAQIINYLKAYRLEVGLLLNFGQTSFVHKRFLRTPPDRASSSTNNP
jgi:GxxExxY protein